MVYIKWNKVKYHFTSYLKKKKICIIKNKNLIGFKTCTYNRSARAFIKKKIFL